MISSILKIGLAQSYERMRKFPIFPYTTFFTSHGTLGIVIPFLGGGGGTRTKYYSPVFHGKGGRD